VRERKRILDAKRLERERVEETTTKKRKGRKKKKKTNYYFDINVQNRIVEYQNMSDNKEKNELYEKHIFPAFYDLVQSLVSVYGFKSYTEDINHLKADCVSFLFETLNKWSPEKGTKAFSYFNVVAKNWLTIQSRRLLKNQNRCAFIDDPEGMTHSEKTELYGKEYVDSEIYMAEKLAQYYEILKLIDYLSENVKDNNDKKCCHAIKQLFDNIDDIEFFNKRAIFVYLREISGLSSTELSSSLSRIRKIYRKVAGAEKMFDIFGEF
jgi:hypothetical protein